MLFCTVILQCFVSAFASCLDPRDYGARAGGVEPPPGLFWEQNTKAIQGSIDAASSNYISKTGSTCVSISGGDYVAGSIYVKTGVDFRVETDSRLVQATNQTVPGTTTGFVNVVNVSDVVISGGGILHGSAEHYIQFFDPYDNRFTRRQGSCLLQITFSNNVTVKHVHLHNSSQWNLHILGSTNVLVDGVQIRGDSRYPENDGIDPDSSINVTILNSEIDVADDGICPKASAWTGMPLRNLYVHNCTIRSKSHAIKFGSNTDTDMHDIVFDHIRIWDSNAGMSIQQRSKGNIYNVTWSNIQIETRYESPRWWGNGEWLVVSAEPRNAGDVIGRTHDLRFINITARAENGGLVSGKAHGVQNVTFQNVTIVLDAWSNYSTGLGPSCRNNGSSFPCMGTRDCRPGLYQNCSYYCRTPSLANGLYFENVQGATLTDVTVVFLVARQPRPSWWGKCRVYDEQSSEVTEEGFVCRNERPAHERVDFI